MVLNGVVDTSGQGDASSEVGCFGGANYGAGGGDNRSAALYPQQFSSIMFIDLFVTIFDTNRTFDGYNPNLYGGYGGICSSLLSDSLPSASPFLGGGLVHFVAGYMALNADIQADGVMGGAGGTVWLQSLTLNISANVNIYARGVANSAHGMFP